LTRTPKYDILISSVGKTDFLCLTAPLVCEELATAFSTDRRTRGFLLEDGMKICTKCKQEKPLEDFYRLDRGKDGKCPACKKCMYAQSRAWRARNLEYARCLDRMEAKKRWKYSPWGQRLNNIKQRVRRKKAYSGIKVLLTKDDLRKLFYMANACSMEHPSIHRIDPYGDYSFENCCYIELSENSRIKRTNYLNGTKGQSKVQVG
jgi:hypothetical protein